MVREGYKQTEIGEIPEEWEVVELSDERIVKTIRSGGTPKRDKPQFYENGTIPYVKIEDISSCLKYLDNTEEKITEFGLRSCSAWLVPTYSILYTMYASYGETCINRIEVATNQAILGIIPTTTTDLNFLYYTLLHKKHYLQKYLRETTQKNLNKSIVQRFPIFLPLLPEQRRISAVLSSLDDAIETTEALIAKLRQVKAGLMQDLLTKGIDDQGRIRSEATHAFKDTDIGRVPVEWEVVKIGDILYEINEPIAMRDHEIYRLISIRRRNGGIFERAKLLGKDVLTKDLHRVIPRTFLIANRQIVHGACAYVTEEFADAAVSSAYTALKGRDNCDTQFFSWVAKTPLMYKYFLNASQGVVLEKMNFHLNEWLDLPLFLPPLSEQLQTATVLTSTDAHIEREEIYRDKLLAVKKGLMADLLTGRVRIPESIVID